METAKVENFRFHDRRHTAAARMLEKDADIRTVQEILVHSSVSVTERYTHTNAKNKKMRLNYYALNFTSIYNHLVSRNISCISREIVGGNAKLIKFY